MSLSQAFLIPDLVEVAPATAAHDGARTGTVAGAGNGMSADPPARAECPGCRDTGLVAPSPFHEDYTPWADEVSRVERLHAERGWPLASSAVHAGLIRPMPCPLCRGEG